VVSKADCLVGIGRDGFSRGVLLVKEKDGKPVVGSISRPSAARFSQKPNVART
jgi:hypothetical protein